MAPKLKAVSKTNTKPKAKEEVPAVSVETMKQLQARVVELVKELVPAPASRNEYNDVEKGRAFAELYAPIATAIYRLQGCQPRIPMDPNRMAEFQQAENFVIHHWTPEYGDIEGCPDAWKGKKYFGLSPVYVDTHSVVEQDVSGDNAEKSKKRGRSDSQGEDNKRQTRHRKAKETKMDEVSEESEAEEATMVKVKVEEDEEGGDMREADNKKGEVAKVSFKTRTEIVEGKEVITRIVDPPCVRCQVAGRSLCEIIINGKLRDKAFKCTFCQQVHKTCVHPFDDDGAKNNPFVKKMPSREPSVDGEIGADDVEERRVENMLAIEAAQLALSTRQRASKPNPKASASKKAVVLRGRGEVVPVKEDTIEAGGSGMFGMVAGGMVPTKNQVVEQRRRLQVMERFYANAGGLLDDLAEELDE